MPGPATEDNAGPAGFAPAGLALHERLLRRALAARGAAQALEGISAELAACLPHDVLWLSAPEGPLAVWPAGLLPLAAAQLTPREDWPGALEPRPLQWLPTGAHDPVYPPDLSGFGLTAHASLDVTLADGSPAILSFGRLSAPRREAAPASSAGLLSCLRACLATAGALAPPARPAAGQPDPRELADYLCAAVAHDIRNIMAGIIGAVELHRPRMDASQGAVFDAVRRRALDGVAMAEAMREHLRASTRPLLGRLDLGEVAARVVAALAPVLRAELGERCPALALELSPAPALADPGEVGRALTALVYNAVRQCGAGNTVVVSARTDRRYAVLEVSDDGPGVPDDVLRRAKEPFYTTEPGAHGGLGLAIADGVARMSDGSLSVRPGRLGGTAVVMVLPLAP
jgi:anti-sigma regulatory factor (Ser/Thr protein kinase)